MFNGPLIRCYAGLRSFDAHHYACIELNWGEIGFKLEKSSQVDYSS